MVIPVVVAQTQFGSGIWLCEARELEGRHCVRRPWDAHIAWEDTVVRRRPRPPWWHHVQRALGSRFFTCRGTKLLAPLRAARPAGLIFAENKNDTGKGGGGNNIQRQRAEATRPVHNVTGSRFECLRRRRMGARRLCVEGRLAMTS